MSRPPKKRIKDGSHRPVPTAPDLHTSRSSRKQPRQRQDGRSPPPPPPPHGALCEIITLSSSSESESEAAGDDDEVTHPPTAAQRPRRPPTSSVPEDPPRAPPVPPPAPPRPDRSCDSGSDGEVLVVIARRTVGSSSSTAGAAPAATRGSRRSPPRHNSHGSPETEDGVPLQAAAAGPRRNPRRRESATAAAPSTASPWFSSDSSSSEASGSCDSDFEPQASDEENLGSTETRPPPVPSTQETTPEPVHKRTLRSSRPKGKQLPRDQVSECAEDSDLLSSDTTEFSDYDPTSDDDGVHSVMASSSESERENVPDSEPEACESGQDEPPRRPGRPRKNRLATENAVVRTLGGGKSTKGKGKVPDEEPPPPKKKRGRPRKIRRTDGEPRAGVESPAVPDRVEAQQRTAEVPHSTQAGKFCPTTESDGLSSAPDFVWTGDPTRNFYVSSRPDEPENQAIRRVEAAQAEGDPSYVPTSEADPTPVRPKTLDAGPLGRRPQQDQNRDRRPVRSSPRRDPTAPWPRPVAGPSGSRHFYRPAPKGLPPGEPVPMLRSTLLPPVDDGLLGGQARRRMNDGQTSRPGRPAAFGDFPSPPRVTGSLSTADAVHEAGEPPAKLKPRKKKKDKNGKERKNDAAARKEESVKRSGRDMPIDNDEEQDELDSD
ncbi:hypothetical protein JCM3774_005802 [Rhodotorula dairenensis]